MELLALVPIDLKGDLYFKLFIDMRNQLHFYECIQIGWSAAIPDIQGRGETLMLGIAALYPACVLLCHTSILAFLFLIKSTVCSIYKVYSSTFLGTDGV